MVEQQFCWVVCDFLLHIKKKMREDCIFSCLYRDRLGGILVKGTPNEGVSQRSLESHAVLVSCDYEWRRLVERRSETVAHRKS